MAGGHDWAHAGEKFSELNPSGTDLDLRRLDVKMLSAVTDTISELTAAAGVTIDGLLLKDGGLAATIGSIFASGIYRFGYSSGGGAVTQITNASTGVTLNKSCGQITTVALTTAAAAEERFTVSDNLVVATDAVVLSTTYDGAGTPMLSVQKVATAAFDIVITNVHSANALNAVMVINFAVIHVVAA